MIKYLQLPVYFDAARMQQEAEHLSANSWKLHYQLLHYEGEWSAIPLRSVGGAADNIMIAPQAEAVYRDTIFLAECPYIQEVLQSFHCPLMAVRLLKLNAGAVIKEHRDQDLYFEKGEARLHIPVITHEEVAIYLDKERLRLKEGECWYMNFNLPHSIVNNSPVDRIHLVIDAQVNDWLKQLLSQPSRVRKDIAEPTYDEPTKKAIIAQLRSMNTETSNRLADEMEK
jgi:hypothetical protein